MPKPNPWLITIKAGKVPVNRLHQNTSGLKVSVRSKKSEIRFIQRWTNLGVNLKGSGGLKAGAFVHL
jgi:hypothetical protein